MHINSIHHYNKENKYMMYGIHYVTILRKMYTKYHNYENKKLLLYDVFYDNKPEKFMISI